MPIASTSAAPYYAVIFTSIRTAQDLGYGDMGEAMAASAVWKAQASHLIAQQLGRKNWYAAYKTRICRVERERACDFTAI